MDKQITAETIAGSFLDDSSFTASYDAGNRISTWQRSGIPGINSRESVKNEIGKLNGLDCPDV